LFVGGPPRPKIKLLRRNNELDAFILWRTALAAAKAADGTGDNVRKAEIVDHHLGDHAMIDRAKKCLEDFTDEDGIPVGSPLDGEGLDDFAAALNRSGWLVRIGSICRSSASPASLTPLFTSTTPSILPIAAATFSA
jgi:hypothetical protein